MPRVDKLEPVFVQYIPQEIEEGKLYISEEFEVSIHLCACGCGGKTVMPFNQNTGWRMKNLNGLVSFSPSVGNFSGEQPYHAHYFIVDNVIRWCEEPRSPKVINTI